MRPAPPIGIQPSPYSAMWPNSVGPGGAAEEDGHAGAGPAASAWHRLGPRPRRRRAARARPSKRRLLVGPQRLHGQDPLPDDGAPVAPWRTPWSASSSSFQPKPTPSVEPAAGQVVERGHLLGGDDRVALGGEAGCRCRAAAASVAAAAAARATNGSSVPLVLLGQLGSPVGGGVRAAGRGCGCARGSTASRSPRSSASGASSPGASSTVGGEDGDADVHGRRPLPVT